MSKVARQLIAFTPLRAGVPSSNALRTRLPGAWHRHVRHAEILNFEI